MISEELNIKVARIYKIPKDGAIKAFVDVSINDALLIKGFRVVSGPRGLFVTMPQEKGKNERWYNTVHCLSNDIRAFVADRVLEAYQQENHG